MSKSDWCPRATYYRIAGVTPTNTEKFAFQLESIFEEGHLIHAKWQGWLAEMGLLWGTWVCPTNREHPAVTGTAPQTCFECEGGYGVTVPMKYAEITLDGEEKFLMVGHADGGLPDRRSLIELKSIGLGTLRLEDPSLLSKYLVETVEGRKIYDLDSLWKGLRRPLPSHLRQGNIYLKLCQEMGLPFDRMVFLYEFKATQAFKEFTVKYTPDIAEPLFETALDIKYALGKGKPVPRPPHADGPTAKVCKACPFATHCWQEKSEKGPAPRIKTVRRRHTSGAAGSGD
jgi:hypothetical protein